MMIFSWGGGSKHALFYSSWLYKFTECRNMISKFYSILWFIVFYCSLLSSVNAFPIFAFCMRWHGQITSILEEIIKFILKFLCLVKGSVLYRKKLAFLQCKEFGNWLFIVLVQLAEAAYLETAEKYITKNL